MKTNEATICHETKHTPGPWMVAGQGDGNKQLPISADGKIIAAVRDQGSFSDARLIAAAPDLLEALKTLVWQAENHNQTVFGMALEDARAAIAKAEAR